MATFETRDGITEIEHVTGYKDDYKVEVSFDEPRECWNPTNEQIFKWLELWFESEDHEFGSGYGRWWPWFYVSVIALGDAERAQEAYGLRGREAVEHYEDTVVEYADDLIEQLEELKEKVE